MPLRVLSWNLMHGRSVPPAGRDLFDEFARALAGWEWDVALLQEVPPWWPQRLAARLDASARFVLTSRNELLPLRRAVALRWPDLIKSGGGGSNAILVRGDLVVQHATRRLCLWPERRWVHAVRLHHADLWVGNLHATAHHPVRARRDVRLAAATAHRWAGERAVILGGDFNLRELSLEGFVHAGGHDVDHLFARGVRPAGPAEVLHRGSLSDHAPVRASFTSDPAPAPTPRGRPST